MAELKKCPFCGGEVKGYADNHKKAMIECKNCNMYFGVQLEIGCELVEGWKAMFDSKEELFEAWNNRANEAEIRAMILNEVLEKAREIQEEQIKGLEHSSMRGGKQWAVYMNTHLGHIQTACRRLLAEQLKEE